MIGKTTAKRMAHTKTKPPFSKGWRHWYAEFGTVERVVPTIFAVLYIAALAGV